MCGYGLCVLAGTEMRPSRDEAQKRLHFFRPCCGGGGGGGRNVALYYRTHRCIINVNLMKAGGRTLERERERERLNERLSPSLSLSLSLSLSPSLSLADAMLLSEL